MRTVARVIAAMVLVEGALGGRGLQTPTPTGPAFEVASVKKRTEPVFTVPQPQGPRPGGAFAMVNLPVIRLVMYAYDVREYQERDSWTDRSALTTTADQTRQAVGDDLDLLPAPGEWLGDAATGGSPTRSARSVETLPG
jgi:hypothetical protein